MSTSSHIMASFHAAIFSSIVVFFRNLQITYHPIFLEIKCSGHNSIGSTYFYSSDILLACSSDIRIKETIESLPLQTVFRNVRQCFPHSFQFCIGVVRKTQRNRLCQRRFFRGTILQFAMMCQNTMF